MLFSAKFSKLEKRSFGKGDYFIAHSSSFDKTGILFNRPQDETLSNLIDKLSLPENVERLGDYEFKITYRNFKRQDGSFKGYFNVIGITSTDSAD